MPKQSESEYTKQERWREDVRAFIFALFRHWVWWLSVTIGSGLVAFCAAWVQHLSGGGQIIPFWVFETAAATGLVVASFRAFCGERRIAEAKISELQGAIEAHATEKLAIEKTHTEEKARLESILKSRQKPSAPTLEIEIIHPEDLDILTSRKTYRIKVKNTHPSKPVKNLKMWLCEIKWPQSTEKPLMWSGIKFPLQLPKKEGQDNSLAHELEASLDMEFDLMFVSTPNFDRRIINLAPFRLKSIGSNSLFKSVDSDLSFNIDVLPKDDSKLIFKFKVTGGEGDVDTVTETYILNVPPLLPETSPENIVKNLNSLCQNFKNFMPIFEKMPAINFAPELAKLNATIKELKDAKAEKAVEKLTEFGQIFLQRISSIKGIDPVKYNPDKDDETWGAIHTAIAYIVLRLTPEAATVFDDGIGNIHGYSLPHDGLGSTIYEDRHREVLAKLQCRFMNLKRIIDDIDKYLKPFENKVENECK